MRYALTACLTASILAAPAHAWNDRGHMLIAMLAYDELRPEVKDRVNTILKEHPQRDLLAAGGPEAGPERDRWIFARSATWPDLVRKPDNPLHREEHHAQWHFINLPICMDGAAQGDPTGNWTPGTDPANIVQATAKLTGEIKAKATPPDRLAIDLCWIEHLIGDIHQPLHAVALHSHQFPNGDKGGNAFAVRRGDTPTNLHSYWDNLLGAGTVLSTLNTQLEGFKASPELKRDRLDVLVLNTDMKSWAKESRVIAQESVYRKGLLKGVFHDKGDFPKDTPVLPSDYEQAAKKVAARQVVLAGHRLADTLNSLVLPGSTPPTTPAPTSGR